MAVYPPVKAENILISLLLIITIGRPNTQSSMYALAFRITPNSMNKYNTDIRILMIVLPMPLNESCLITIEDVTIVMRINNTV